jgi:4-diphosphocytidyl-2-C-methyl-D-erythritol kinase
MQKLVIQAPAKLNLTIDITGLAPNGCHALDMVMQTISLCDSVTLGPSDELSLACPPWLPTGPKNLAFLAAQRLREYAGIYAGALITLEKNIPAEAGLGGGSADAAAVLKGLNGLWGLGLAADELRKIGIGLGSDVPFALAGGAARVKGTGEIIEPIEIKGAKPLWFLLAKPAGGVRTAEAYKLFDRVGVDKRPQNERFIEALKEKDIEGMARHGGNALEKAAVQILPEIGELLKKMKAAGTGYCAVTGSGSAVFGVFENENEARNAQEILAGIPWTAVACSYYNNRIK